jgi:hypothetical protein
VQAGKGDAGLGQVVHVGGQIAAADGRLAAAVHRFHLFDGFVQVKTDGCHEELLSVKKQVDGAKRVLC